MITEFVCIDHLVIVITFFEVHIPAIRDIQKRALGNERCVRFSGWRTNKVITIFTGFYR